VQTLTRLVELLLFSVWVYDWLIEDTGGKDVYKVTGHSKLTTAAYIVTTARYQVTTATLKSFHCSLTFPLQG
jgi:hypothetical protein